ncbi:MAG TPA: PhoH family protein [Planctomycetes bacterium]|nr:PhoH family protein [Planctomycetota bacterium]
MEVTIPLRSHEEAIHVLGPYDRNAKFLRRDLGIELYTRNGNLRIRGGEKEVALAKERVEHLLGKLRKGKPIEPQEAELILAGEPSKPSGSGASERGDGAARGSGTSSNRGGDPWAGVKALVHTGPRRRPVVPRTENQRHYLDAIARHTLTLGVGVAGTGKTFLAVSAAVDRLRAGECRRLIITRPVVEAGEHLGFLPGDLQAKLNPYMRPVYDALFDLVGFEETSELEDAGVIEVAPLAYMRGRTLSDAFVILDEAQNTTVSQMKMFLTRLGEGSCMVVTGDPTQSDLDGGQTSGLLDAVRRLRGQAGIAVVEFDTDDIVRHPLVERIVRAYEGAELHRHGS